MRILILLLFAVNLTAQGVQPQDIKPPFPADSVVHSLQWAPPWVYPQWVVDTAGVDGDVGQVGFFTSSDTTDFNTATYQVIDWDQIQVNDTFVVTGSQVELTEAGKYRLFTNLAFAISTTEISDIDVRIRKNGSTILPAAAHLAVQSSIDHETTLTLESFDQSGSAGDYYEVVIKTGGGVPYTLNLIDTSSSFIISTVAGGSGPQGPAGIDGLDGTDGVSVDTAYVLNDSLYVELSNGTTDGGYYVKGDQGPAGEDGIDGNVLDSNDWYLDTILTLTDSTFQFDIRNRYGGGLEKSLTLLVPQAQAATPQVLTTSSIAGGGRTSLDQGGGQFDIVGGTNSTVSLSGDEYSISSVNNFANSLSFNTGNGILSLGRNGLSTLTTDLDGRYLQSATNYWTLSSGLLYPNNTSDNVLIGTTSNVFSSKLRVAGHTAITRGAGTAFTISDANGFNEKWEFGYTTSPVESYADVTTNATTTWRQGVDNSGEYFFSATGARSGADFVFEDDGDVTLDQYASARNDVTGNAPSNRIYTDAFGTLQSSPVGVMPYESVTNGSITMGTYDYFIEANAITSDCNITLPQDPPGGKTYILGYQDQLTNRVKVSATGATTVDGQSTSTQPQSGVLRNCLVVFVYDGSGNYRILVSTCSAP